jgi:recombination protein RecR
MSGFPKPIADLLEQFNRLPGIGPKTAQRLAFHVLSMSDNGLQELIQALYDIKEKLTECPICCAWTDEVPCANCADSDRDHSTICLVGDTRDVVSLERMQSYQGVYHVLGGVISPIDGIGPDQLHVRELLQRLADEQVKELIIATDSTMEGEATAHYVAKLVHHFESLTVTRLGHGLPVGGDLEYADEMTLARAFEYRRPI